MMEAEHSQLIKEFIEQLYGKYVMHQNNYFTQMSLKLCILEDVLNALNLSWKEINQQLRTDVFVHNDFFPIILNKAKFWLKYENKHKYIQKFMDRHKCEDVLDYFEHEPIMFKMIAMDGLGYGNLSNMPHYTTQHYLSNLVIPLTSNESPFNRLSETKIKHVKAVRALYDALFQDMPDREDIYRPVYQIIRKIIKDEMSLDLPIDDQDYVLSPEVIAKYESVYLKHMKGHYIANYLDYVKNLPQFPTIYYEEDNGIKTPIGK